jgi:hypothetical protein
MASPSKLWRKLWKETTITYIFNHPKSSTFEPMGRLFVSGRRHRTGGRKERNAWISRKSIFGFSPWSRDAFQWKARAFEWFRSEGDQRIQNSPSFWVVSFWGTIKGERIPGVYKLPSS